jgi:hypothetical protein
MGEFIPWVGQTAGFAHEVRPAAEVVQSIVTEAEAALSIIPKVEC